ncbi:MAG: hypothetical protein LPH21_18400 [Shewanella sp.]|nr:hypothetical protein [Shewanella sp.]
MELVKIYAAKVRKTRTADDLTMRIDLGVADIQIVKRVRLKDVDAPNVSSSSGSDAEVLRDEVHTTLSTSPSVLVEVLREHQGGVLIGKIYYVKDGDTTNTYVCLNDELVAKGFKYSS